MKKRIITISLVIALLATCFAGTYAYLTDKDAAVNTMTLGSVDIEQYEYERELNADGTYKTDTIDGRTSYVLTAFTQNKPLYPIVGDPNEPGNSPVYAGYDDTVVRMSQVESQGSMQVFAGKNAQDKFIVVKNTGKSDAYVRTLVAFECGSKTEAEWANLVKTSVFMSSDGVWTTFSAGVKTIDGSNYVVWEYIYNGGAHLGGVHENGILPAGETTYPGLCQIYLKHYATNEDMTALDGNNNGKMDILVLSQAVQAAGFDDARTALDAAFGTVEAKAADWFENI